MSSRAGSEPPAPAQPLGATLATPATLSGELSLGERAAIANSKVSESPAKPPGPTSWKKAILLAAIVICGVVALLVARHRPVERRVDVNPGAAATPAAPPMLPSSASTAPPVPPAPHPATPVPPTATAPLSPPAANPSVLAATATVRTLSEHSKRGSNRRTAQPALSTGNRAARGAPRHPTQLRVVARQTRHKPWNPD